jgi:hypothetical protein
MTERDENEDIHDARTSNDGMPYKAPARPSPTELAALVDQRLSTRERQRVLAAIAASPEALELLDDIAYIEANEAQGAATPPAIHRKGQRWLRPAAWLAAASIVVAAGVTVRRQTRPLSTNDFALALDGTALPAGWYTSGRVATRGAATPSVRAQSVRIGAALMDLQLATRADSSVTATAVSTLRQLVGQIGASVPELEAAPVNAAAAERSLVSLAPMLDPEALRIGAWLRGAWVAAQTQNREYFLNPASRRVREAMATMSPASRRLIDTLDSRSWPAGGPQWTDTAAAAAELLTQLAEW